MHAELKKDDTPLFFRALRLNGWFSTLAGFNMIVFCQPLAGWIGFPKPLWLAVIGVGLVPFGLRLLWLARQGSVRRGEAWQISFLDLGWVLGSGLLLLALPGLFNSAGVLLVIAIGLVVLALFEAQVYALYKTRRVA